MKETFSNVLSEILDKRYFDDETCDDMTGTQIIALRLFQRALRGDVKAFEVIRDTCGQVPPIKSIITNDIDPEVAKEVEQLVYEYEKEEEQKQ